MPPTDAYRAMLTMLTQNKNVYLATGDDRKE